MSFHMLDAFRRVALRWHEASKIPNALHHIRTVSFPKPGKAVGGKLRVSDTRPISVLNTFWRLWITAWTKSESMKSWAAWHLPPETRVRAGQAVRTVGPGVMIRCPRWLLQVSCTTLASLRGWLTKAVTFVWTHQVRWISWFGTCCEQPLHTEVGVPQGDPVGHLWFQLSQAATSRACP